MSPFSWDYAFSRQIMALHVEGNHVNSGPLRHAACKLIGYGCPARQYELDLF